MSAEMWKAVREEPGYLGVDTAHGITVSYFRDLEAIQHWKGHARHQLAQEQGRARWYEWYHVHIAKVERRYSFVASPGS